MICTAIIGIAIFSPSARAEGAPLASANESAAREKQFLYLLRTYPERPPDTTLGEVAKLVGQGPFAERDRAMFWIGSARLSLGDLAAARAWFGRLGREAPGSVWVQRSYLGLAEADAMEHDFAGALRWYSRAAGSSDATVRELSRIATPQIVTQQRRQHLAWLCTALWLCGALALLVATLREARKRERAPLLSLARRALALPGEARVLLPLLAVVALASLRQDPAARDAALELCLSGAVLVWLSGAFLRARPLALPLRALYALGLLGLLGCGAYLAIWRHDLVGMIQETWRAGPD